MVMECGVCGVGGVRDGGECEGYLRRVGCVEFVFGVLCCLARCVLPNLMCGVVV